MKRTIGEASFYKKNDQCNKTSQRTPNWKTRASPNHETKIENHESNMSRTLELISSDNMSFHIDEVAGMHMSQYIKLIFEEGWYPDPLSLSMVPSNILPKIIEYCHTHVHGKLTAEELKEFDSKFLNVDRSTLFGLIVVRFNSFPMFYSHYYVCWLTFC